jgi:(S)-ureidoglycine-glyoxylate aminotransferase
VPLKRFENVDKVRNNCYLNETLHAGFPPLDPPNRLLMGSGPSNPEARVLRALASPPTAADHPAQTTLLNDLTMRLRHVFCAGTQPALVVPGASRAGIEAVLASVIEPDDTVLVGVYGHFGELLCTLAGRLGAVVKRVDVEWGRAIEPDALVEAIRRERPKLVAIVHADTSTGILQPLAAIGRACREVGSLLVVDAVLSLGGCELRVDDWLIDAAVGGAQKCLGSPPGLAPLTYSDRLGLVTATRRSAPFTTYLDLRRLEANPMASHLFFGLREALLMVEEEGLEARWVRHARAGRAVRAGIQAMGLELFGDQACAVPMITLVRVPEGQSEPGVREQLLLDHGVEIMAAFGPLRGQVWRIGSMGTNARLPSVLHVLSALEAVLSSNGWRLSHGAAVAAAHDAFES